MTVVVAMVAKDEVAKAAEEKVADKEAVAGMVADADAVAAEFVDTTMTEPFKRLSQITRIRNPRKRHPEGVLVQLRTQKGDRLASSSNN